MSTIAQPAGEHQTSGPQWMFILGDLRLEGVDSDRCRVTTPSRSRVIGLDELLLQLEELEDDNRRQATREQHHERWCDVEAHAQHAAECGETVLECQGPSRPYVLADQLFGTRWRQDAPGRPPYLWAEWPGPGLRQSRLDPDEVEWLLQLLDRSTPDDVAAVTGALRQALTDLHSPGQAADADASTTVSSAACPTWCVRHEVVDQGHPTDEMVVHHHAEWEAAGQSVRLTVSDFADGRSEVTALLGENVITPASARRLAAALLEAAASTEAAERSC